MRPVMEVRRLAWAGLEITADGQTAVIDLVEDFPSLHSADPPTSEMPPISPKASATLGLLTHLHKDHADPRALRRALRADGVVLRPQVATGGETETALVRGPEAALTKTGLATRVVHPWETVAVGDFTATALPAVDGFGDPQLSWVVTAHGCRILHAGDTLFHGWWWLARLRHGPFDVAFLPCGGAVVDLPSRQPPSPFPAGMGSRQAAVAAKILGAQTVVPIHYGPLHEAPDYVQADDVPGALLTSAHELGITARVLQPGERLRIKPVQ